MKSKHKVEKKQYAKVNYWKCKYCGEKFLKWHHFTSHVEWECGEDIEEIKRSRNLNIDLPIKI